MECIKETRSEKKLYLNMDLDYHLVWIIDHLKFEEWNAMRTQTIFVSATPGPWELEQTSGKFTEQVIRPTGLCDPEIQIRPAKNQVDDLLQNAKK